MENTEPRPAGCGSGDQFIAVHDNKPGKAPRVSLLTVEGAAANCRVASIALQWPTEEPPKDFEAISGIPGRPNHFLVLASNGELVHISYEPGKSQVKIEESMGKLKPEPSKDDKAGEFEGLCVARTGEELVLLWATRGQGESKARLFGAKLDAQLHTQGDGEQLAEVAPPFEDVKNLRSVSDLRVDEKGWVWAAAARDPGEDGNNDPFDNGPFESKVYVIGSLQQGPMVRPVPPPQAAVAAPPSPLAFPSNKVEAIEFYGNHRLLVGTDDEDLGGWVQALDR